MKTTYIDKNKDRYQITTAPDGEYWTALLVRKNGKIILSDLIQVNELEFHLKKRAQKKSLGVEIDMKHSDVLEDQQVFTSQQASDLQIRKLALIDKYI